MRNVTATEKVELTLRDITDSTGINQETIHLILTEDLDMTSQWKSGTKKFDIQSDVNSSSNLRRLAKKLGQF